MQYQVTHCGIVILAAGQSKRMGQPKQMLHFQEITLLEHAINTALATQIQPVVVVLGAHHDAMLPVSSGKAIRVVVNDDWPSGMASSLKLGLHYLQLQAPQTDGVIFMLCDQPFVSVKVLSNLMLAQQASGKPAVACSYAGKLGTPALFHSAWWSMLQQLTGDTGARNLLAAMPHEVATIIFEEGAIDIDTEDDYKRLLEQ
jgi:molybdenum cofactor cytidylyltransferase